MSTLNAFPQYADCVPGEEWRPVPGCSRYEVSSMGRVRSWCVERSKKLSGAPRIKALGLLPNKGTPYHAVSLMLDDGNGYVTWRLGRLVLHCFIGPCPAGQEALHGRGGSLDDRLVNLRYGTHIENVLESRTALSAKELEQVRTALRAKEPYRSIAKRFNRSRLSISRLARGLTYKDPAHTPPTKEEMDERYRNGFRHWETAPPKRSFTYNGRTLTIQEWATELGIKYTTVLARINYGRQLDMPLQHTRPGGQKHG